MSYTLSLLSFKIRMRLAALISVVALCVLLAWGGAATAQDNPEVPTWDEQSRFTLLVMGLDRRPSEPKSLNARTDAMMLISIDPQAGRIGVFHIPRDLHFAPMGENDLLRVNTLVLTGEGREAGYGPQFAVDTLQFNLGMYIDRYLIFDFDAFITLVDALGGVEITTLYTISDPAYPSMDYKYDPFYLPAGTHLLDGEAALKYARTRHGDNDYVRGIRQMQVIEAIHHKASQRELLLALLPQLPRLLDALRDNLYTDLTLTEMLQLARVAALIPPEAIITGGLNTNDILLYSRQSGVNIYIPDRAKLAELLVEIFGENYNL